jgi:integrase
MALRWADVDLANGVLHVERSYDPKAGEYVEPKSRSGRRRVPSLEYCATRSTPTGRRSPPTRSRPRLCSVNQGCRSMTTTCGAVLVQPAWQKAKLEPIGPYAARHTAASTMIAAGLNVKALSTAPSTGFVERLIGLGAMEVQRPRPRTHGGHAMSSRLRRTLF